MSLVEKSPFLGGRMAQHDRVFPTGDRARELLQESRRVIPNDPWALHELGMVEAAAGNEAAAREHLEAALVVWRDADPEFKEARQAREKLAELQAGA